eukprot:gene17316-23903_t
MQVSTVLSSGQVVVGDGVLDDNGSNSITIPRNSQETINLIYNFNSTYAAYANLECYSSTGVTYTTTGTVAMKTRITNFNNIQFGPWINIIKCTT